MQKILEISRNFINCNNFSKYSLIFAFSIILAENKYIFTYLIRISIKMTQNKYTYQKKVSRRNPEDPQTCASSGVSGDRGCVIFKIRQNHATSIPPYSTSSTSLGVLNLNNPNCKWNMLVCKCKLKIK